jgi:gas vesicle protein
MQLQPVSTLLTANPWQSSPTYNNPLRTLTDGGNSTLGSNNSGTSGLNATIESESYSKQTLDIEFTSKDGDKVSLSMESLQYQKSTLQVDASGSPEDMQKIIDYLKDQYKSMREAVMKAFVESQGGTFDGTQAPTKIDNSQEPAVPEYWNAENTSQRIVDFATQLLGAFKGSGEDFLKTIKGAIDEGFKQATDQLGKLPDQVSKLVSDTHDLIMQKLDKWAETKGITSGQPEAVAA